MTRAPIAVGICNPDTPVNSIASRTKTLGLLAGPEQGWGQLSKSSVETGGAKTSCRLPVRQESPVTFPRVPRTGCGQATRLNAREAREGNAIKPTRGRQGRWLVLSGTACRRHRRGQRRAHDISTIATLHWHQFTLSIVAFWLCPLSPFRCARTSAVGRPSQHLGSQLPTFVRTHSPRRGVLGTRRCVGTFYAVPPLTEFVRETGGVSRAFVSGDARDDPADGRTSRA
jgi:hypothetical protein